MVASWQGNTFRITGPCFFFAVISLLLVANTLTNNDLLSVGPQWTELIISLYLNKNRKIYSTLNKMRLQMLSEKSSHFIQAYFNVGSVGNTCTSTCDDLFK